MKKIALVIASEGYQPIEYGTPKHILEMNGFEVVTVSDNLGMARAGYDGSTTQVDLLVENAKVEDFDGLFFVGGPGALEHLDNETSYALLRAWKESQKPYGAICISPRILAHAGVLTNKKATGWDGDEKLCGIFEEFGVEYVREPVVVDGHVVTADGPKSAEEFGKVILKVF